MRVVSFQWMTSTLPTRLRWMMVAPLFTEHAHVSECVSASEYLQADAMAVWLHV